MSPWVIVGLPRTGTSLLSLLLGLDPSPGPSSSGRRPTPSRRATLEEAAEDPRIARSAKDLAGLMKLNPPLKAMHPFGATLAEECVALFMYDVRVAWPSRPRPTCRPTPAGSSRPTWPPPTPSTGSPSRPSSRASPPSGGSSRHPITSGTSAPSLAAYPDARIIWTHRDPGPVVTSLASLANAGQRILTSRDDPRPTAEEWKRKCAFALDSAMAFDERSEAGWCQHLHYDALMADPLEAVRAALPHLRRRGGRPPCPAHGGVPRAPAPGRLRPAPLRPRRLRLDLCRAGRGVQRRTPSATRSGRPISP